MSEKEVSPIIDRLCKFIEYSQLTNSQFADKAGIPRPSLSQMLHGRNKSLNNQVMAKLNEAFPELNIVWLLFGSGNMLINSNFETSQRQNSYNQPLDNPKIPISQEDTQSEIEFADGLFAIPSEQKSAEINEKKLNEDSPAPKSSISPTGIAALGQTLKNNIDSSKKIASIIVLFSDGSFESFVPQSAE